MPPQVRIDDAPGQHKFVPFSKYPVLTGGTVPGVLTGGTVPGVLTGGTVPGVLTGAVEYSPGRGQACYKDITFWLPPGHHDNTVCEVVRAVAGTTTCAALPARRCR